MREFKSMKNLFVYLLLVPLSLPILSRFYEWSEEEQATVGLVMLETQKSREEVEHTYLECERN